MNTTVGTEIGVSGLLAIVVTLLSIYLAWVVLQELKLDSLLKRPKSSRGRMLQIMLAILIGHGFASFILDYWKWSQMLSAFVE
jgi:uncharacterized integral membrane protein (TIGR02327 family)